MQRGIRPRIETLLPAQLCLGESTDLVVHVECPEPVRAGACVVDLYCALQPGPDWDATIVAIERLTVASAHGLARGITALRLPLELPAGLPPSRSGADAGRGSVRYGADVRIDLPGRADAHASFAPTVLAAAVAPAHLSTPVVLTIRSPGGHVAGQVNVDAQVMRVGEKTRVGIVCSNAGRRVVFAAQLTGSLVRPGAVRTLATYRFERELGDTLPGTAAEVFVVVPPDATASFQARLGGVSWSLDVSLAEGLSAAAVARVPVVIVEPRTPLTSVLGSGLAFR